MKTETKAKLGAALGATGVLLVLCAISAGLIFSPKAVVGGLVIAGMSLGWVCAYKIILGEW